MKDEEREEMEVLTGGKDSSIKHPKMKNIEEKRKDTVDGWMETK